MKRTSITFLSTGSQFRKSKSHFNLHLRAEVSRPCCVFTDEVVGVEVEAEDAELETDVVSVEGDAELRL